MDESSARKLASALGGETWHSGGGMHLVLLHKPDGRIVVFSDELVAEYANEHAFERGRPVASIILRG